MTLGELGEETATCHVCSQRRNGKNERMSVQYGTSMSLPEAFCEACAMGMSLSILAHKLKQSKTLLGTEITNSPAHGAGTSRKQCSGEGGTLVSAA